MRTIETVAVVTKDGSLTVKVPPGVSPGEHRVVLVIEETPQRSFSVTQRPPLELNVLAWTAWPANSMFSRDEIYDDDDR